MRIFRKVFLTSSILLNIAVFSLGMSPEFFENLTGIVTFIFVLSILVLVHEAGHFFIAKKAGIKVEVFSLGFGRKILKRKIGDTEYCLSSLPLGGYVKMAGDEPQEEREGTPWEYLSQPPGKRALVVFAGPLMNYIFAFFVFALVLFIGKPESSTKIGPPEEGKPAQLSNLLIGDEIIAINKINVRSWYEMVETIRNNKNPRKQLTIKRGTQIFDVVVQANMEEKKDILGRDIYVPVIGVVPYFSRTVEGFTKDSPAKDIGLQVGDEIVSVEGEDVLDGLTILDLISQKQDKIKLSVLRDGKKIDFQVVPDIITVKENDEKLADLGIIFSQDIVILKYGIWGAFSHAGGEIFKLTRLTYTAFGRLFTGKMSLRKAGTGPVGIAFISIQIAAKGIIYVLLLLASLSVSLAIVNLLPFPVLDGGHILFLLIEKIRGKALSLQVQENINKIAVALLILLFLYITWSDLEKFKIIDNIIKKFPLHK
ncbi:MAG: RIP metalloprotease RseP [Candidatus Omnitrophota bacterium]